MNYLSFLPLAVVSLAAVTFGLVLVRDILRAQPGPIVSPESIELDRAVVRIERFNRKLDGYRAGLRSKRHGASHE